MTKPSLEEQKHDAVDFITLTDACCSHTEVLSKILYVIEKKYGFLGWKGIRVQAEELKKTISENIAHFIELTNADELVDESLLKKHNVIPMLKEEE